jgi:hypothetical protein
MSVDTLVSSLTLYLLNLIVGTNEGSFEFLG